MQVSLVDFMGSDLSVVNAARVSFNKKSKSLTSQDERLISYLSRHNHWTPFGHTCVTLHVKAPIFVARQLGKHQVGLVWNEVSRRYVDDEPELYSPEEYRGRPVDKKQGSGEKLTLSEDLEYKIWLAEADTLQLYKDLIEAGVAPEMARMYLPQSTYTEWYWTGSVAAFSRVCGLRLKEDTQEETRTIAQGISDVIEPLFPVSWKALMNG